MPPDNTPADTAPTANADFDRGIRMGIATMLGHSGYGDRDRYDVFGWETDPTADEYYGLYLRNPYAYAVVAAKPHTTWRDAPDVVDEGGEDTEFEDAVAKLSENLDAWRYAARIDRMAGIGQHGVLVLDLADTQGPDDLATAPQLGGLDAQGLDLLRGFRVYSGASITDVTYGKPGTDRWGLPVEYEIDLGDDADDADDEDGTLTVHHERVVDVPSRRLDDDETLGRPRLEPVLNVLYDIEKTLGSVAELSYRGADYGLHVNYDPEKVDTTGGNLDLVEEELEDWYHGLQPWIRTVGGEVNRLGGDVLDPTGIIDNELRALSAQTGIPKRMLEGSSAGELASAQQDERDYFGLIAERREQYATPYIVRRLVDRLRSLGILPDPSGGGYSVEWPDLTQLTEEEEATVQEKRSVVVKNAMTAIPDLRGARAEEYIETGAFPEREGAEAFVSADQVDESNPDVQDQFARLMASGGASANGEVDD